MASSNFARSPQSYRRAALPMPESAATVDALAVPRPNIIFMRRREPAAWLNSASQVYFYGVLLLYSAFTFVSPHPPLLQDYPTWVYEGVAAWHAFAGHPDPQFMLKTFPVPNALSDLGLAALSGLFGWKIAAKLWVVIYLALSAFSYRHFSRALKFTDSQTNWIVPSLCILNLCFWYGFINFQFAVTWMVLFCSCLLRHPNRMFLLAALLSVTFLSHAIPFAVCSLALMAYIVAKRAFRMLSIYIPVVVLGGWYLYGRFVLTRDPESAVLADPHVRYLSASFVLYKVNCYFKSVGTVHPNIGFPSNGGVPALLGQWAVVALAALVGLALFYVFANSAGAAFRKRRPERILWSVSGAALLIGLLCPSEALGISDPGSRFVVCALVLAVLCSRYSGRIADLACCGSAAIGVIGALVFANIAVHAYAPGMFAPPRRISQRFAAVAPQSRAYYYHFLEHGKMDLPTFDTAILLNRH